MTQDILSDRDLDVIFREARSFKDWQDMPVSEITIRAMYDLLRWGPTSFNCSPARFTIVQSDGAKKKLTDCVSKMNKKCVLSAPFSVIVGTNAKFHEQLPSLFAAFPTAHKIFEDDETLAKETAHRNSCLQGAYMIIAARSLGLDCSPLSGFDMEAVNETFFNGSETSVNFICSIGYGASENLPPRDRRLSFDEACEII